MHFQQKIDQLFTEQQRDWKQLRSSIKQFDQIKVKEFNWGNELKVDVQFNPSRIESLSAKVDKSSIEERPCFLCEKNRPTVQSGIPFLDKYIILLNPFPILRNHLTIALHSHVPQRIRRKTGDMLLQRAKMRSIGTRSLSLASRIEVSHTDGRRKRTSILSGY